MSADSVEPAIGIDLGTKISCAAICRQGGIEIITNHEGSLFTPSTVTISNSERLVGQLTAANDKIDVLDTANIAWHYTYSYSKNGVCVSDAKRLIGSKFDDPNVREYAKYLPFDVVDAGGKAKIRVESRGRLETFSPEEIGSMVLAKIREIASAYSGTPVMNAVISVPSGFNDAQRQATRDAALVAGFYVLRLINDTSAAALTYAFQTKLQNQQNILIFDFGGGSLSVSILAVDEESVQVISSAGDTHLGGEDFNNRLMKYAIDHLKDKYKRDISKNRQALAQLKVATECAKQILSTETATKFVISSFDSGIDFSFEITRPCFETICADLFTDAINLVKKVLTDAKLSKDDIQDVVLVGACSRIPMVQTSLRDFFHPKSLNLSLLLAESVAYGAAVQAAILTNGTASAFQNIELVDVAPLSLGIAGSDGSFYKVIERNTPIPCKRCIMTKPLDQNQSTARFRVFEGESAAPDDNNLLACLALSDIPPTPGEKPQFEVSFDLHANGVLHVSVAEKWSGHWTDIIVRNEEGCLPQQEFEEMVRRQTEFIMEEGNRRNKIMATPQLTNMALSMKSALKNTGNKFSESEKNLCLKVCDDVLRWLTENSEAGGIELLVKLKHLLRFSSPLVTLITHR